MFDAIDFLCMLKDGVFWVCEKFENRILRTALILLVLLLAAWLCFGEFWGE